MPLKKIVPQFVVPDVVKTAEYYRDFLGFKILGYWQDPPIFSIVERDGVELHFGKGDLGMSGGNIKVRHGSCDAYIWVTDVDALFAELKAKGVHIIHEPIDQEYGSREMMIKDCNSFILVFAISV